MISDIEVDLLDGSIYVAEYKILWTIIHQSKDNGDNWKPLNALQKQLLNLLGIPENSAYL